jgi:hypothetical protein
MKRPLMTRAIDHTDIEKSLADGLLSCLTQTPWSNITLAQVAEQAGIPLPDLAGRINERDQLLTILMRRNDHHMISASGPFMAEDTAKDRLFDVIMARIDILQANRGAYLRLFNGLRRDPLTALSKLPSLKISLNWMLHAAQLGPGGIKGHLQRLALGRVYLQTIQAWRADDSADLGKTMAKLDQLLAGSMRFIHRRTSSEMVDWTTI